MKRLLLSFGFALLSGVSCWYLVTLIGFGAGDFSWAYYSALDLLYGVDPYSRPSGPEWTPYPLPAALFAVPFTLFTPEIAAAVFFALSSGLLAYAFHDRLLIFVSCPYFVCLQWAQWTPLITASASFPVLGFVLVIKPHIALPISILHLSKTRVISAVVLLMISLTVDPLWPFKWTSQLGDFQNYIPLFTIPGPILLLALRRWHDPDARLLLLASIFPQRWFYDALFLWLIPKTRKELLYTSAFSWGAYLWRLYQMPTGTIELGFICVVFFYLPMLLVILKRPRELRPN